MDATRLERAAQALGETAAGLMMAVLRIMQTLFIAVLLSVGVLILASANFNDTSDLLAIGTAVALLLVSVIVLAADNSN
jgi:uncharacterized membrane protein YqjE